MAKSDPTVKAIAQAIVARLDTREPKHGAKRNREAIALVIGAAMAAEAIQKDGALAGSLRMLAFLTSTRGATQIQEIAES